LLVLETVPIVGAPGAANNKELEAELAVDVPLTLVAVTVYVRVPAAVSVMTIGLEAPVLVMPEEDVTVYPVIEDPPVAPAVKVTDAFPSPAVAVPIVGACGIVVAVILDVAADAADVAVAFVALAVNVYDVLDCRPVTVTGDAPVPVNDPGEEVTV
jgi:hypothetical protein